MSDSADWVMTFGPSPVRFRKEEGSMMDNKRIAIITGASSGMGFEFAKQIDAAGNYDELWLIARNKDKLKCPGSNRDVPKCPSLRKHHEINLK